MIIGEKDKERVRMLEAESKLSRELIRSIRNTMLCVLDTVQQTDMASTVLEPYSSLAENIGRCNGHLDLFDR